MLEGGLIRGRSAALAAGAAFAMFAIPMTTVFAEDGEHDRPEARPTPAHLVKQITVTHTTTAVNAAACQAAITALKNYALADQAEDTSERQTARLNEDETNEAQLAAADQTEDQTERTQLQPLFAAVETACEPVTTTTTTTTSAACTAAQTALKNFNTADRAEDLSERQTARIGEDNEDAQATAADKAEDQSERAQLKPLQMAVAQACGETEDAPSSEHD